MAHVDTCQDERCPNSNRRCTPWPRRTASPPTTGTGRAATSRWPGRPWSRCWPPSTSTRPRPMRPRRRSTEQQRRPWTRMLPPLLALREHRTASVEVHVPHGDPAETWIELETGGHRGPLRQLENWTPAAGDRRRLGRRGLLRDPRRPAAGLPHAARPLPRADSDDAADHHPGAGSGCRSGWGSAAPGDWPRSSTAFGRASPGASVTSPTWRIWPSGRPASTAPTTS